MTVSRAFKRDTSVSADTRDRILKAAEELGYVFDSIAANLSSRRYGFVAMRSLSTLVCPVDAVEVSRM